MRSLSLDAHRPHRFPISMEYPVQIGGPILAIVAMRIELTVDRRCGNRGPRLNLEDVRGFEGSRKAFFCKFLLQQQGVGKFRHDLPDSASSGGHVAVRRAARGAFIR